MGTGEVLLAESKERFTLSPHYFQAGFLLPTAALHWHYKFAGWLLPLLLCIPRSYTCTLLSSPPLTAGCSSPWVCQLTDPLNIPLWLPACRARGHRG